VMVPGITVLGQLGHFAVIDDGGPVQQNIGAGMVQQLQDRVLGR
jgi:hypothetical protein